MRESERRKFRSSSRQSDGRLLATNSAHTKNTKTPSQPGPPIDISGNRLATTTTATTTNNSLRIELSNQLSPSCLTE